MASPASRACYSLTTPREPSRASHARLYQAIAGSKAAGVSANTIAEAEQKLMLAIERDARREQEQAQLQVYRDRM